MATAPRPDAIMFPVGWEPPAEVQGVNRMDLLMNYFEPILGLDPAKGERAYTRHVFGGSPPWNLVTASPTDTVNHPHSHRRAKTPRYNWVGQPNGLRYGYLIPDDSPPPTPEQRKAADDVFRKAAEDAKSLESKFSRFFTLYKMPTRTAEEDKEMADLRAFLVSNSEQFRIALGA